MTSRAILALGVGQLVNWGVLYYAFGVLMVPVERDLGVERWVVAGAFSLALLMSAAAAPLVGRLSDRGRGPLLIRAGGFLAAALLAAWSLTSNVATLYLAWAGLGLCMAATLYEPAFAVVGQSFDNMNDRLRALATVTVLGGLASTAFLPLTAFLNDAWGWRVAVGALAGIVCLSTAFTSFAALRTVSASPHSSPDAVPPAPDEVRTGFGSVLAVFSMTSLASAAFTTTLVPAFVNREFSSTTAALLGGVLGLMQLPGRVLLMNGRLATSPVTLLIASLLLQAAGLAILAAARSVLVGRRWGRAVRDGRGPDDADPPVPRAECLRYRARRPLEWRGGPFAAAGAGGGSCIDGQPCQCHRLWNGVRAARSALRTACRDVAGGPVGSVTCVSGIEEAS